MSKQAPSEAAAAVASDSPETGRPGRRRSVIVLALVLVAAGAAGYMTLLRGDGPSEPVPGEVVVLDPIQINLTKGHYLRLALALQLTEETAEVDGSKALDAAITLFSGRQPEDLLEAKERASLKSELVGELAETYEGKVMDVYFTEFVTQ